MSSSDQPDLERWLDVAARGLPRRIAESVRAEYRTHYEDAVREAINRGLPAAEAKRRALLEMGAADDVARRLRSAHLGRLRLALVVVAGLAVITLLFGLIGLRYQWPPVEATATRSLAAAASPSAWRPVTYTVRPGDTLFSVACQHGVPASAIAALNDLAEGYRLRPGDVLLIGGAGAAAPDVLEFTVEVVPGATVPPNRSLSAVMRLSLVRVAECPDDGTEPRSP